MEGSFQRAVFVFGRELEFLNEVKDESLSKLSKIKDNILEEIEGMSSSGMRSVTGDTRQRSPRRQQDEPSCSGWRHKTEETPEKSPKSKKKKKKKKKKGFFRNMFDRIVRNLGLD